jgi:hypothetical protein
MAVSSSRLAVFMTAARVVMGAGHYPSVFPAQVGPKDLLNSTGGAGGYVDAKVVEHLDGPGAHSTGDDHVGPHVADESGHRARLMCAEVWIGYDL